MTDNFDYNIRNFSNVAAILTFFDQERTLMTFPRFVNFLMTVLRGEIGAFAPNQDKRFLALPHDTAHHLGRLESLQWRAKQADAPERARRTE